MKMLGKLVARYSYGIYLVHGPCLELAFKHFAKVPMILQWLIFFCGTAGLSYVAYHAIEKPGIALGMRLARRLSLDTHHARQFEGKQES
jgi:peptidoglycan/LPS O-acetylase OafA/YrhL